MKKTLLTLLLLLPIGVNADLSQGTPFFFFFSPTTFTDNSPLNPATDLTGYNVYCGGALQFQTPTNSYQSTPGEFTPGTYDCEIEAEATPAKGGQVSTRVPFPRFTVTPAAPAAPNPVTNTAVQ